MKKNIVFAFILLMVAACNKHSDDSKPYVPLNTNLKNAYSFKEGSYWIYRDSTTGREDSFFVSKYQHITNADITTVTNEELNLTIKDYPIVTSSADSSSWLVSFQDGTSIGLQYQHLVSPNEYFAITYLNSEYPFITGSSSALSLQTVVYPNLSVRNVSYSSVAQLIHGASSYYMKDSVGFVKINMTYQTIHFNWELERYHINF